MDNADPQSRRGLLLNAGVVLAAVASTVVRKQPAFGFGIGQPLPPAEDLMQEHGVLERVLLIYEELSRRFEHGFDDSERCLGRSTHILTAFIQGHHERVEELLIFPALTKANVLQDIVATLVTQHQVGAQITDTIAKKLQPAGSKLSSADQTEVAGLTLAFVRMFRPHMARENTVVFPTLRKIMSHDEYDEFSTKVQTTENKMVPVELKDVLKEVDQMEQVLGIHDLNKFTADTKKS